MKKLVLLLLLFASSVCLGMDGDQLALNKLLSQLSRQVMTCSSLGYSMSDDAFLYGGSMWKPSNEEDVKPSCDRIFERFIKIERALAKHESKHE